MLRNIQWGWCVPPQLLRCHLHLNSWWGTHQSHKLHHLLSKWVYDGNLVESCQQCPPSFKLAKPATQAGIPGRYLHVPGQQKSLCCSIIKHKKLAGAHPYCVTNTSSLNHQNIRCQEQLKNGLLVFLPNL
jgi:hypothetical protein